jgi:O-antigen ligase
MRNVWIQNYEQQAAQRKLRRTVVTIGIAIAVLFALCLAPTVDRYSAYPVDATLKRMAGTDKLEVHSMEYAAAVKNGSRR